MDPDLYLGQLQKCQSTQQSSALNSLFVPSHGLIEALGRLGVTSNQLCLVSLCLGQNRPIQSGRPTVTLGVTNGLIKEIDGQTTLFMCFLGKVGGAGIFVKAGQRAQNQEEGSLFPSL